MVDMADEAPTDDIVAIHQLLDLYGHVVDGQNLDALGEVFTDDATFDASGFGQGLHRGLGAIRAIFALGAPPHPPAHLTTNTVVFQRDGHMFAHSKWLTIDRATGGVRSGDYHDELINGPDGWRIARRRIEIRFYTGDAPDVSQNK